MPCKRILSVIHNELKRWDDLPEGYRQSPFLILDSTVSYVRELGQQTSSSSSTEQQIATKVDIDLATIDLPLSSANQLKHSRSKVSSLCTIIKDWVHKSNDTEALHELLEDMMVAMTKFRHSLPQDDTGFLMEQSQMTKIASQKGPWNSCISKQSKTKTTNLKKSNIRKNLHDKQQSVSKLPKIPTRSRASRRHGAQAEELRKAQNQKLVRGITGDHSEQRRTRRGMNMYMWE